MVPSVCLAATTHRALLFVALQWHIHSCPYIAGHVPANPYPVSLLLLPTRPNTLLPIHLDHQSCAEQERVPKSYCTYLADRCTSAVQAAPLLLSSPAPVLDC